MSEQVHVITELPKAKRFRINPKVVVVVAVSAVAVGAAVYVKKAQLKAAEVLGVEETAV